VFSFVLWPIPNPKAILGTNKKKKRGGIHRFAICVAALGFCLVGSLRAQVNVVTYHNDNARTGQNTQETILSPADVNSTQFGKLFTVALDGWVYAQPLYLSNVSIAGGTHNVLYVATEHDSLYAIDADSGATYWHISLIPAGGSTPSSSTDLNCSDMVPEHGITGTPVIDTTSGTIYMVAVSKVNGSVIQQLHAIDVVTSREKFGAPINIAASVPGTAVEGNGSSVSFNSLTQNQRPGLLLENGHVVIAWGSNCDHSPWHGWVLSYNAATLVQDGAFNTSPNGFFGGIWMSGGALAADAGGNIFFATGNGSWNGTTDFGDSIVKLGPASNGILPVADYFTPYNQATLSANDQDVASGGLVLLPALPSGRQLLAQMAKLGTMYVLDRSNMGKYCVNATPACTTSDPQIAQEIPNATVGMWGSPAYWNGYVYWGGANDDNLATDGIKAFALNANNSGLLSTTPTSKTAVSFAFSAPVPSISANGTTSGILWGLDDQAYQSTCSGGTNCQILYAYDATDLTKLLYSSNQAANNRDVPGGAVKFATPTIANGKVYVGSQYAVSAFGLLGSTASSPTLTPAAGTYASAQSVSLSDTTPGAVIYFTTDGTTPTINSTKYVASLQISATTIIKVMAAAAGYASSAVTSATYVIGATTTPVSANLAGAANVNALGTNGAAVTDGGIDNGGTAYSAALTGTSISWGGSTFTLAATNALNGASNTTAALPAGNFSTLNMLATGVNGSQANQTFVVTYTDGTTTTIQQSLSDWFYPQHYAGESVALSMTYRLISTGAAGTGPVNIYGYSFAINGAKTVKSITLPKNRNVVVMAIDLTPSGASAVTAAATPTVSPSGGSFTSTQQVTLSDSTPGAVIYYTLDGTTPTTASSKYTAALSIASTTTVKAIAVASGYASSAIASASYTISAPSTAPVAAALGAAANVQALLSNGTAVANGGIDNGNYAYSATLAGTSVTWSGATFVLGASGTLNGASGTTVNLSAGNFSKLTMLATGVNGSQVSQAFVVTYTDGTTTTIQQSLSDWFYPQNYSGESTVLTMAYRLSPAGVTANGPVYLYGYTFAINGTKTTKSITLPQNRNVVVLAIDLTPSGSAAIPTAASPALSPAGGSYTSVQTVTLSDATPGAVIYYTTDGTTPNTGSPRYSTPLQVSSTTTIEAIAVASGYTDSAVASAPYTISTTGTGPAIASLASASNVQAIVGDGTPVTSGGIDSGGTAYSATLIGSLVTWSGSSFSFGTPTNLNGVSNSTVSLPAGNFSTLKILATAVNGTQVNQTFVVTYTDGTTTTIQQSLSDWFYPQNYAGESIVLTMTYRLALNGTADTGPVYLSGYAFPINSAKTVKSLALPNNRNVVTLAVTLSP
jgi:hypothetical protein